jgi:hypothetical protein
MHVHAMQKMQPLAGPLFPGGALPLEAQSVHAQPVPLDESLWPWCMKQGPGRGGRGGVAE